MTERPGPTRAMTTARVAALALLLGGCAYHRLVTNDQFNPADQYYHPVSSTAVGWGAIEQKRVAKECPTSLLAEVRVRTSLADALATVLTLGLVQPAHYEYRCSKDPTGVGEIKR